MNGSTRKHDAASTAPAADSPYLLRYMQLADIPQVIVLDNLSFPTPWNPKSYEFEIAQSQTSHMVTLTRPQSLPAGWRGWWGRLRGQLIESIVVGYAGMWVIAGEVHISTIAVHPAQRGQHLGEVILNGLMQRAMVLKSEYAILEVRTSNVPAQALYRKYGYEVIDTRSNYYRDNGEDAYIMQATPLDATYADRLHVLTDRLKQRVWWVDRLAVTDRRGSATLSDQPFSETSSSTG